MPLAHSFGPTSLAQQDDHYVFDFHVTRKFCSSSFNTAHYWTMRTCIGKSQILKSSLQHLASVKPRKTAGEQHRKAPLEVREGTGCGGQNALQMTRAFLSTAAGNWDKMRAKLVQKPTPRSSLSDRK
jgi:hypothetical protein